MSLAEIRAKLEEPGSCTPTTATLPRGMMKELLAMAEAGVNGSRWRSLKPAEEASEPPAAEPSEEAGEPSPCCHCGAQSGSPHKPTCAFVQFTRQELRDSAKKEGWDKSTFTHADLSPQPWHPNPPQTHGPSVVGSMRDCLLELAGEPGEPEAIPELVARVRGTIRRPAQIVMQLLEDLGPEEIAGVAAAIQSFGAPEESPQERIAAALDELAGLEEGEGDDRLCYKLRPSPTRAKLEAERNALAEVLREADPDWYPDGTPMIDHVRRLLAEDASKQWPAPCRHCGAEDNTLHDPTCIVVHYAQEDLVSSNTFTHYDLTPSLHPHGVHRRFEFGSEDAVEADTGDEWPVQSGEGARPWMELAETDREALSRWMRSTGPQMAIAPLRLSGRHIQAAVAALAAVPRLVDEIRRLRRGVDRLHGSRDVLRRKLEELHPTQKWQPLACLVEAIGRTLQRTQRQRDHAEQKLAWVAGQLAEMLRGHGYAGGDPERSINALVADIQAAIAETPANYFRSREHQAVEEASVILAQLAPGHGATPCLREMAEDIRDRFAVLIDLWRAARLWWEWRRSKKAGKPWKQREAELARAQDMAGSQALAGIFVDGKPSRLGRLPTR